MRPTRRILLLLVPLVAVVAGCADTYQVAVRAGDLEMSHDEVAEEAELWASSPALAAQFGVETEPQEGRVPQALVTEMLNLRIQAEIAREILGPELDSPDGQAAIEQARAQAEAQFAALFEPFPDDVRARTIDDVAVLQIASSQPAEIPDIDVFVSSRYGEVGANGVIDPPPGARPGRVDFLDP